MAESDQQQIREQLLAERTRLEQDIYARTQGDQAVAPVDPLNESGGVSSHQADNADAVSDFERNQAIVANSRAVLAQAPVALQRLDSGAYGTCARCGKSIEPRRLQALPYATLCFGCEEVVEREGQA